MSSDPIMYRYSEDKDFGTDRSILITMRSGFGTMTRARFPTVLLIVEK